MLDKLRDNYASRAAQLQLIAGSYLSVPFCESNFNYVVSVYTMHHFTLTVKVALYRKIFEALRTGGRYIEGDCVVTPEKEQHVWDYYAKHHRAALQSMLHTTPSADALLHIDLPCTVPTQMRLFREAGFSHVNVVRHREEDESAIFVVAP